MGAVSSCAKTPQHAVVSMKAAMSRSTWKEPLPEDIEDFGEDLPSSPNIDSERTTTVTQSILSSESANAIEQIFLLCENGILPTMQFIISSNPQLEANLNETRECSIADVTLSLTPLQFSAACGHADVTSYLLTFAAVDPNSADQHFGLTALHLAILLDQCFVVETLCRDDRVDVMQQNSDGKSCLQLAIERENFFALESIIRLRSKLDVCQTDFDGNTILHSAAMNPHPLVMEQVLLLFDTQLVSSLPTSNALDRTSAQSAQSTAGRLYKQLLTSRNHYGESALDILMKLVDMLRSGSNTAIHENASGSLLKNAKHLKIYDLTDEERDSLVHVAKDCIGMLQQAVLASPATKSNSSSSSNLFIDVNEEPMAMSGGCDSHSALSWSPRNEAILQLQQRNQVHCSPLEAHID